MCPNLRCANCRLSHARFLRSPWARRRRQHPAHHGLGNRTLLQSEGCKRKCFLVDILDLCSLAVRQPLHLAGASLLAGNRGIASFLTFVVTSCNTDHERGLTRHLLTSLNRDQDSSPAAFGRFTAKRFYLLEITHLYLILDSLTCVKNHCLTA